MSNFTVDEVAKLIGVSCQQRHELPSAAASHHRASMKLYAVLLTIVILKCAPMLSRGTGSLLPNVSSPVHMCDMFSMPMCRYWK